MVQNTCSQCHALSLVTNAGYSREEWQTVFSAMVDLPKDQSAVVAEYFGQELPRETETSGGGDSRKRDRLNQGVGRALARLAASRSARDSGWQHLVDGAMGQRVGKA